jgi:hypothetical protein
MMDFLFGPTPEQEDVDKATDPNLQEPDWSANMAIVDKIRASKD